MHLGEAIVGLAQIYSIDYAHWNIIEAHAVDFVSSYRFSNSAVDSSVLVTVKKTSAKQAKLAVVSLSFGALAFQGCAEVKLYAICFQH